MVATLTPRIELGTRVKTAYRSTIHRAKAGEAWLKLKGREFEVLDLYEASEGVKRKYSVSEIAKEFSSRTGLRVNSRDIYNALKRVEGQDCRVNWRGAVCKPETNKKIGVEYEALVKERGLDKIPVPGAESEGNVIIRLPDFDNGTRRNLERMANQTLRRLPRGLGSENDLVDKLNPLEPYAVPMDAEATRLLEEEGQLERERSKSNGHGKKKEDSGFKKTVLGYSLRNSALAAMGSLGIAATTFSAAWVMNSLDALNGFDEMARAKYGLVYKQVEKLEELENRGKYLLAGRNERQFYADHLGFKINDREVTDYEINRTFTNWAKTPEVVEARAAIDNGKAELEGSTVKAVALASGGLSLLGVSIGLPFRRRISPKFKKLRKVFGLGWLKRGEEFSEGLVPA